MDVEKGDDRKRTKGQAVKLLGTWCVNGMEGSDAQRQDPDVVVVGAPSADGPKGRGKASCVSPEKKQLV